MKSMAPRIAIPMPHSSDPEYAERAIPQYEKAVTLVGGEPVRIRLDQTPEEVRQIMERCDGVLLPGSKADVDPAKFNASRSSHTAAADPRRDAVDDLLLEDAYRLRKPVLGICYGLQTLNVFRKGSLIQHIPDFLPEAARAKVDHEAGRGVPVAHAVEIEAGSRLGRIVSGAAPSAANAPGDNGRVIRGAESAAPPQTAMPPKITGPADGAEPRPGEVAPYKSSDPIIAPVNSSHHQAADEIGEGLRVVARCTEDGIIEAVEGTSPDHFVVAVQWHPERSVEDDAASREIFRALIAAANERRSQGCGSAAWLP